MACCCTFGESLAKTQSLLLTAAVNYESVLYNIGRPIC